jgi:hypothetical protein
MKKYIVIFSALLLTAQYASGITKNDILQALVSSHNGAFGKDNLYKEQITSDQLNAWNSAMNEMKKFVVANSSNALGMKDGDLTKALSTIEAANIDLVNTIKITRATITSPATVKQNISALDRIKQAMLQVQKNINAATFMTNKAEKTLAKEILINAAMFIETTAAKAIRDTAKM